MKSTVKEFKELLQFLMYMDSLYSLMDHMSDYIVNYSALSSKLEVQFFYIVKMFDSIEKDLDFDEEYYSNIISRLQTLVISECKFLIETLNCKSVKIIIGKQISSRTNVLELEVTIKDDIIYRYLS